MTNCDCCRQMNYDYKYYTENVMLLINVSNIIDNQSSKEKPHVYFQKLLNIYCLKIKIL